VFIISTDDDNDDEVTVYNVPLKRVFGSKYKCASFYRDNSKIVLTLVSTGFPATDNCLIDSELPFGNSHVRLQSEDNREVIFSFSTVKGQTPTLLLEYEHFGRSNVYKCVALLSLLLIVVYYYY